MSKLTIATIGLLGLLSACATTMPAVPAGGGTSASAPALAGTSWTVSKIKGADTLADTQPTMAFTEDTVAGLASCNRFSAGYTQTGAQVTVSQIAQTAMMCADESVMTQEQNFTAALTSVGSARSAGDGVELLNGAGEVALTLVPVQNKPLEGTTWELTGIITTASVSSVVADSSVTMTIADGSLSGKACNSFHGTVTAGADGSISVGPLASTRMACTSDELTKQEQTVLSTLAKVSSYEISGSGLTLKAADGTGLEFLAGS